MGGVSGGCAGGEHVSPPPETYRGEANRTILCRDVSILLGLGRADGTTPYNRLSRKHCRFRSLA